MVKLKTRARLALFQNMWKLLRLCVCYFYFSVYASVLLTTLFMCLFFLLLCLWVCSFTTLFMSLFFSKSAIFPLFCHNISIIIVRRWFNMFNIPLFLIRVQVSCKNKTGWHNFWHDCTKGKLPYHQWGFQSAIELVVRKSLFHIHIPIWQHGRYVLAFFHLASLQNYIPMTS